MLVKSLNLCDNRLKFSVKSFTVFIHVVTCTIFYDD